MPIEPLDPPPPSERAWGVWQLFGQMTPLELKWLAASIITLLGQTPEDDEEDDLGGTGVREPRRPGPKGPLEAAEAKSLDAPT